MDLLNSLDYTIENQEDRLELVKNILEQNDEELVEYFDNNYNPHLKQTSFLYESSKIGKELEQLATYILYAKDMKKDGELITDHKEKRNKNTETSIHNDGYKNIQKRENNRSILKTPKVKVNKKDRLMHEELAQTGIMIEKLTKMIETGLTLDGEKKLSLEEIKKLKWIRTDIQKDEVAVKHELKKYVSFNINPSNGKNDEIWSMFNFSDVQLVKMLLDSYGDLTEACYEDTNTYLKATLMTFEDLVEKANFEDYMKDILILYIDDLKLNDISNLINDKYNMATTVKSISHIIVKKLPKKIVEAYKQDREDWLFTYVTKGKFKTCEHCNQNFLALPKYFDRSPVKVDGLKNKCKKCISDIYYHGKNQK